MAWNVGWSLVRWRSVLWLVLLGTLLFPSDGSAWGRNGHKIVCEIAFQRLTPEARALVKVLQKGEAKKFAETCLWADDVKYTTRKDTYKYHFVNIPTGKKGIEMTRDCPNKDCAPWAIEYYGQRLGDAAVSRHERNEALKFVGHFVGDLHQPMHCGRFEDRGGNSIEVCFLGDCGHPERPMNLHRIWDSRILNESRTGWRRMAKALHRSISDAEAKAWGDGDVLGWTNESYRIAEEFAYPALPADGVGREYYEVAKVHVDERLRRAGVRLADLINRAAAGE